MLGMTRDQFRLIWRHFHVQADTQMYQEGSTDNEDNTEDDDKDLTEQMMERVQMEEEEKNKDYSSVEGDDSDEENNKHDSHGKEGKVQKRSDDTENKVDGKRERESIQTRNINGFAVNFTPYGRNASKTGHQEYSVSNTEGKLEPMILFITSFVDTF
eukprot:11299250-Ditylum_brightwellii.AAC.1